MSDEPPKSVEFTPLFVSFMKQLTKKYRNVSSDLQPLVDRLVNGEIPGDQIKGTKYTVYKVRVKNTDAAKGKSGGYRVIYYLKIADRVVLLAIYSKSDQIDIPINKIRRMIEDFEASLH